MGNPDSREILRSREFYFKECKAKKKTKNKKLVTKFNIMITSYDIALHDITYLKKINWELMIVDEAHRLKNNESKFFK